MIWPKLSSCNCLTWWTLTIWCIEEYILERSTDLVFSLYGEISNQDNLKFYSIKFIICSRNCFYWETPDDNLRIHTPRFATVWHEEYSRDVVHLILPPQSPFMVHFRKLIKESITYAIFTVWTGDYFRWRKDHHFLKNEISYSFITSLNESCNYCQMRSYQPLK